MRLGQIWPAANGKTKYLNIVYFVESARSHTIRINLAYARWAIAALVLLFAWSIASLFWIANLNYQSAKTRARLETALTTIFDYQIRTDKVLDEAYPMEVTKSYYSELAQLPSNNPIAETLSVPKNTALVTTTSAANATVTASSPQVQRAKSEAAPATQVTEPVKKLVNDATGPNHVQQTKVEPPQPPKGAIQSHANESKEKDAVALKTIVSNQPTKPPFDILRAQLSKTDSKIRLNFEMHNKNTERAEGFIWAVARIALENGESQYLTAPENAKIDSKTGLIITAKSGYRFNVRKFKNKAFEFKTPTVPSWKLTKLTIYYTDLQGNDEQSIEVPVEHVAIDNLSDTAATEVKL